MIQSPLNKHESPQKTTTFAYYIAKQWQSHFRVNEIKKKLKILFIIDIKK